MSTEAWRCYPSESDVGFLPTSDYWKETVGKMAKAVWKLMRI